MRSVPLAMMWELFCRGRWSLLFGVVTANLLPTIIFLALGRLDAIEVDTLSARIIHSTLIQINMFVFGGAVIVAQGSPSRLYTFPIPTSTLVAWHMFPAMILVAVEMCLSTIALNAIFDVHWPLWGPALFVGATIGACQATFWLTDKTVWLPLMLSVVAGSLGYWYLSRFAPQLNPTVNHWVEITPVEVLFLLCVAVASYFVGILAVSRNRCGEPIKPLGIVAWIERLFDIEFDFSVPFRSPEAAHFWFEWRLKGLALPAFVVFGGLLGLICWAVSIRDPRQVIEGILAGGIALSVGAMIVGLIMGNVGPSDSKYEMGHFLGSRPMTSTTMARTILKVTGKTVLIAWTIWAASLAVISAILLLSGYAPTPFLPHDVKWWYFPATLLSCWAITGVVASLMMTGRMQLMVRLFVVLMALCFGFLWLGFLFSREVRLSIAQGLTCAGCLALAIGCARMFVVAWRRRQIGLRTVIVGLSVWLTISSVVVFEWARSPIPYSVTACISLVGVCALVVIPLAAAPLAIAWNRVR